MKKVILNSHIHNEENIIGIENIVQFLRELNVETFIPSDLGIEPKNAIIFEPEKKLTNIDFVFSIGGDGTMLNSAIHSYNSECPLLGINTGRLGFLASSKLKDFKEITTNLMNEDYQIDERTLLSFNSNKKVFDYNFALNEFSVLKRDSSSMILVNAYLNGEFLNSYWADGLIISTPTGSTGYSLSCGGPLVQPHSKNFIITPICPHNLNVRPLIVSDDSTIQLEIEGRSDKFLGSLDTRTRTITSDHRIEIRKDKKNIQIVKFPDYSYLRTLNKKLHWGNDSRNFNKTFEI